MNSPSPRITTIVLCFFLGAVSALWVISCTDHKEMKEHALEAGVAEYYLDEDNKRQWRWITHETKREEARDSLPDH